MVELLKTPTFGILLSIGAFGIGMVVNKKTGIIIFNPQLIAIILCIGFLVLFKIDIGFYEVGGDYINFLLKPATVLLAVPLYKQINILKPNIVPILGGILAGSVTAIVSIIGLSSLFRINSQLVLSMVPKSVTIPIGIEISSAIGGISSISIICIMLTGNLGVVMAEGIFKLLKIEDEVAKGVAFGTSAHALGTSRAMEIGEKEGAMSSLSIGIAGLITVFIAPILIKLFLY